MLSPLILPQSFDGLLDTSFLFNKSSLSTVVNLLLHLLVRLVSHAFLSLFVLLVLVISTSTFDICSFLLFVRLVRFPFKFPCLTLVYSRKYRVRTVVVVALILSLTQRLRDLLHTEH